MTKDPKRELCSQVYHFLRHQGWTTHCRDLAGLNANQMRLVREGTCPIAYLVRLLLSINAVVAEGQSDIERSELAGLHRSLRQVLDGMTAEQHLELCRELYDLKHQRNE